MLQTSQLNHVMEEIDNRKSNYGLMCMNLFVMDNRFIYVYVYIYLHFSEPSGTIILCSSNETGGVESFF